MMIQHSEKVYSKMLQQQRTQKMFCYLQLGFFICSDESDESLTADNTDIFKEEFQLPECLIILFNCLQNLEKGSKDNQTCSQNNTGKLN